jgi:hypothetical protein
MRTVDGRPIPEEPPLAKTVKKRVINPPPLEPFPFVEPPEHWKGLKETKCLKGTRWWVEKGGAGSFRLWIYELLDDPDYKQRLIPLQWVPEFVGVTRAAVHKRAKAGKLTVFSFVMMEPAKEFVGTARMHARSRYDYASVTECEGWQDLLDRQYQLEIERKGGNEAYWKEKSRAVAKRARRFEASRRR